jgi:hypothetical protein
MRHSSASKVISHPTTVLNGKPDEKFAFTRCPTLPYPPPQLKSDKSVEKCTIRELR